MKTLILTNEKIIRAWKDAEFRRSLSAEERAALPEHPAGVIELDDEQMRSVVGGGITVNTRDLFFTVCDPNCKKIESNSRESTVQLASSTFVAKL